MPSIIHVMPSSCLTKSGLSLGIDRVEGEMLPEQKHEVIKRLQDEGKIVAMAGYGINDAPALSQAHVGIGMDIVAQWLAQHPGIEIDGILGSWQRPLGHGGKSRDRFGFRDVATNRAERKAPTQDR